MTPARAGLALVAALVIGLAAWAGWHFWSREDATPAKTATIAAPAPTIGGDADEVVVDVAPAVVVEGATPMAERVAVIGLLNKRNGEAREFELRTGQAARFGGVIVRLRACERTAPWEVEQLTGAFLQLDVQQPDSSWRRAFSGWLYADRPALNVVEHPVYDIWPKSCAMTFPEGGEEAPSTGGASRSSSPSSAPKSAATPPADEAAPAPTAAPEPSADDSNDA